MRIRPLLVILLAFAAGRAAVAREEPPARATETPPAPKTYLGREIATTMHYAGAPWLIRESREREEDTRMLLKALDIQPGMTICDLGCGNGFYTIPLARLTGSEGRVYAVDIQPEMLDLLGDRAREAHVDNIEPVLGTAIDPRLPDGKIDLILLVDVYHEISHPEQMLAAMKMSLSPDGRIALVEFRAEDPDVPIKPLHKMTKAQMRREFAHNGFEVAKEFDDLPWQHVMWFRAARRSADPNDQ